MVNAATGIVDGDLVVHDLVVLTLRTGSSPGVACWFGEGEQAAHAPRNDGRSMMPPHPAWNREQLENSSVILSIELIIILIEGEMCLLVRGG